MYPLFMCLNMLCKLIKYMHSKVKNKKGIGILMTHPVFINLYVCVYVLFRGVIGIFNVFI